MGSYPAVCGSYDCGALVVKGADDGVFHADVGGDTAGRDLHAHGCDGVGDDLALILNASKLDVVSSEER